jgi:hypothetical protein
MRNVTTRAKRKPARVFLYAQEKFGKTSFAAHAPDPIFAMTRGEDGLLTLMNAGRLPPTAHFPDDLHRWDQLRAVTCALRDEDHDRKTFVVDTANGAARLLAEHVCCEHFGDSWTAFDSYGKGHQVCVAEWIAWLADLDRLREDRSMSIILLSHAEVKSFKNPAGADYDRYQPEMPKPIWSVTHKWGDVILFGSFKVHAQVEGSGKDKKVKGQGGNQRVLYAGESAAFLAGNRYGLPHEISCGNSAADAWKNFVEQMKKARPAEVPKQAAPAEAPKTESPKTEPKKPETAPPTAPVDDGINEPPGLFNNETGEAPRH